MFSFGQIMAQPLMWLMLIATAIGKCLMLAYSVVKEPWRSKERPLTLFAAQ